jgi:hypothetical protein
MFSPPTASGWGVAPYLTRIYPMQHHEALMQFAAMDLHFDLFPVLGFQAIITETAVRVRTLPVRFAVTWLIMFRPLNRPNKLDLAHIPRLYPQRLGLTFYLRHFHRVYPLLQHFCRSQPPYILNNSFSTRNHEIGKLDHPFAQADCRPKE